MPGSYQWQEVEPLRDINASGYAVSRFSMRASVRLECGRLLTRADATNAVSTRGTTQAVSSVRDQKDSIGVPRLLCAGNDRTLPLYSAANLAGRGLNHTIRQRLVLEARMACVMMEGWS